MGKSWPRVDVLLHTPRMGVRKTFDFGGVQRRHRASFVEPNAFVELLRQIGPGNNGSRTWFRIRSIKGLRSAPSIDGNDSAASARFRTSFSPSGETGRSPARTCARLTFLCGRPPPGERRNATSFWQYGAPLVEAQMQASPRSRR
jgi:hypothetical protein